MLRISCRIIFLLIFLIASLSANESDKLSADLSALMQDRPEAELPAWVYFQDKGPDMLSKRFAASENLTEKALQRRQKENPSGQLTDEFDVPVYAVYLQEVAAKAVRIRHKSRWLNAISLEASAAVLQEIAALSFVKKIDVLRTGRAPLPDTEVAPSQFWKSGDARKTMFDYGPSLTQNEQMNVIPLHDMGLSGDGVLIASFDSGFPNLTHIALQNIDVVATWDFINGDSIVDDQAGQAGNDSHGTFTLGSLAGFQEGQVIGPAFGASYLLAKTEVAEYERHIEEDNWVAAAEWADSLGVDVISSSLGYFEFDPGEGSYTANDMDGATTIITQAAEIAASRGILVIVSAGNEGPGARSLGAPADGPNVLAVGGVSSAGGVIPFSSRGPTADGRTKPDIMALGSGVRTTSGVENNYITLSGTSFSCPLATGAAALLLEASPQSTAADIRMALRTTANNSPIFGGTPDDNQGWGIINAQSALEFLLNDGELPSAGPSLEIINAYPNPFNETVNIQYNLPAEGRLVVRVFNVLGERLATIYDRPEIPGVRTISWTPENTAQGIYLIAISANGETVGRKVVYLRFQSNP